MAKPQKLQKDRLVNRARALWGTRPAGTGLSTTFARVCQVGVFWHCHWTNSVPFPPCLPLSFHTHTQPLNNDNNDQDGYYTIFLAVADYKFHGNTPNCSFSQFKSPVGGGDSARNKPIWIKPGRGDRKVIVLPAALILGKLASRATS